MIEFFSFSSSSHILVTFILGVCVLSQTLAFMIKFYRSDLKINGVFENLLEVFILIEIFIFSFLHGQVINGYKIGFVVPSGHEVIRMTVFFMVLILVIAICVMNKTLFPISVIPAVAITLPIVEKVLGPAFPWAFIASLIFFLARSIKSLMSSIIVLRTSISALSVKNAIDTLETGVLFSENDGYINLANHQMQKIMLSITGKIFRSSIQFYDTLLSDKCESKYKKSELEGQTVYLLPNESAWILTKTVIPFKTKDYIHISFSNVSELWSLTTKLQQQHQELTLKSQELKKTIANLHIITKEKEIEKAKIRAHDILGQRLTVLLRTIQNEQNLDYELLTSLSKGLLDELKSEDSKTNPYDELKNIQSIFASIGVDIVFEGKLPKDIKQASLFISIIREGSTNAVRHGLATKINIKSEEKENSYNLTINNNGYTTSEPIISGSGISLMKKKVIEQGGKFKVIQSPLFTLSAVLPVGGQYV